MLTLFHASVGEPLSPVQLRVSKGLGTRPYGTLRVSVITDKDAPPPAGMHFDYSGEFQHRWTQLALHSSLVELPGGSAANITLGGSTAHISLPAQGAGVAGVLIADPCVKIGSLTALLGCEYGHKMDTFRRTPKLLNAFVGGKDTDYWGVLGDNWYDRTGHTSALVYERIALPTLSKPFITVPGNHDYWILGGPKEAVKGRDQFGNGHMQYYAMDTLAARNAVAGSAGPSAMPFNTSVDPEKGIFGPLGGNLPAIDNTVFYQQIGNIGIVGFSGAYAISDTLPRIAEACAWLPKQPGLEVAVLVGHWDIPNLGANVDTMTPGLYEHARGLPGCKELDVRGKLKFVMGHTHCNTPHPHQHNSTGFMVAGMGMEGCANYGIPILDSTGGRLRFWYFSVMRAIGFDERRYVASLLSDRAIVEKTTNRQSAMRPPRPEDRFEDRYEHIMACLEQNHGSWRKCTQFAELWLDEPL